MGAKEAEQTLTVLRLCEQHDVGIVINLHRPYATAVCSQDLIAAK